MDLNDTILPVALAVVLQGHNTSMFVPIVCTILLVLGIAVVYSRGETKSSPENKEPPVLTSKVPFFGHLIGMLRWQVGYMQMLRYIGTMAFDRGLKLRPCLHLMLIRTLQFQMPFLAGLYS